MPHQRRLNLLLISIMFGFSALYIWHTVEMETENRENVISLLIPPFLDPPVTTRDNMKERYSSMQSACSKLQQHVSKPYNNTHNFLKSLYNNHVFYCPVPKAGWSTWKRLFYRENDVEHLVADLTKTGFDSEWERANLTVVKFVNESSNAKHRLVFVRNPYERMISAYIDKVLRNNGSYVKVHQRPCRKINPKSTKVPALTFAQFVGCILIGAMKGHKSLDEYGSGSELDIHWRPQTLLCNFCSVKYTIIGHMDTVDEDLLEALTTLGMNQTLVHENNSKNENSKTSVKYWFSQLSKPAMEGFNKLYKYDLEILNYTQLVFEKETSNVTPLHH